MQTETTPLEPTIKQAATLEAALSDSQGRAQEVGVLLARAQTIAKALQRASLTGDLPQLRSLRSELRAMLHEISGNADGIIEAWPWTDSQSEEQWMEREYGAELRAAANAAGLSMLPYGKGWSVFPVIVTPEPKSRTIRVNKKRVKAIRPSHVIGEIRRARGAKPRQRPEQFLEILFAGYRATAGAQALEAGAIRPGSSVRLVDVYASLNLRPTARAEYPLEEFVRDVYMLDIAGLRTTEGGSTMHLSAATSTKTGTGVLTVVDDAGRTYHYFAIAFREGSE